MKKRKDGRYQKQITIIKNGKKVQKCFYGKTVSEINKKLLAYSEKDSLGKTFKEIAEEWEDKHSLTLSPSSLKGIYPAVKRAIEYFGNILVKDIRTSDVNRFIVEFSTKGYAQKTVLTQLQVVRQILDYAILSEDIEHNVAKEVKIPKNLRKEARELPNDTDIEIIKENAKDPDMLLFVFAMYTGMRRGEILALQGKDVDIETNIISVNKSVYYDGVTPKIKTPKTDAGTRTVVLLEPLKNVLPKINPNEYYFGKKSLLKDSGVTKLIETAQKKLNITCTLHQLRHFYATRLYELGIDEKAAQDLLGHADITTTHNIYTHIREQKRDDTFKILQNF